MSTRITILCGVLLVVIALHLELSCAEPEVPRFKYRIQGMYPQSRVGRSGGAGSPRWSDFLTALTNGDYKEMGNVQPKRHNYRTKGMMPYFRVGRSGTANSMELWNNYLESIYSNDDYNELENILNSRVSGESPKSDGDTVKLY